MYVIRRNEDGKFVTPPGSKHSYTRRLEQARVFHSKDAAERECCGNERAVPVESMMQSRRSR